MYFNFSLHLAIYISILYCKKLKLHFIFEIKLGNDWFVENKVVCNDLGKISISIHIHLNGSNKSAWGIFFFSEKHVMLELHSSGFVSLMS